MKLILVMALLGVGTSNVWADEIYDFDYWANNGYSITTEGSYNSIAGCSYAINVTDGTFTYSLNDRLAIRFRDSNSRDLWNLRNGHGLYCYRTQNIAFLNLKSGDKIILTLEGTVNFVSGYLSKESVAVVAEDAFVSDAEYEVTADCNVHFNASVGGKIHKLKIIPAAAKVEAPSLSISSMSAGASVGLYHPVISVSSSEATSYGASFTPDGGEAGAATITDGKYTFTQAGTLSVWGIKAGNSNSAVSKIYLESANYILDASNSVDLSDEDFVDCSSWTSKGRDWSNWGSINDKTFYTVEETTSFPGMTLNSVLYSSYCPGVGLYYTGTTGGGRTVTLTGSAVNQLAEGVYYSGYSTASTASKISLVKSAPFVYTLSAKVPVKCFNLYTPATEVEAAIYDCKACDNSAAFATAIDAESFATAAEVYAFNTTYHITNGVLTDGVRDITGVIRNAAVTDGTDWNSASTYTMPTKYTGAPDNVVLDAYNYDMDAYQIIWGLPAGTYIVTANTRGASTGGSSLVYVNKEPWVAGDLATAATDAIGDGESAGTLGYGFSTQRATFTITEATDIRLGFYAGVSGEKWASCDDWHLYRVESVPVTVSDAGFATYVNSDYDLNFSTTDIKAYKVKVSTKGVATLNEVANVPAGTPVLLYKAGGATEDIPVIASAAAIEEGTNDLVAGTATTATDGVATIDGLYTNMILNNVDNKIGFYYANGKTVAENRAYLHILTELAPDKKGDGARMTMVFADEETGINSLTPDPSPKGEGSIYTLSGQRVSKPMKGLYIIDGKKVLVNDKR